VVTTNASAKSCLGDSGKESADSHKPRISISDAFSDVHDYCGSSDSATREANAQSDEESKRVDDLSNPREKMTSNLDDEHTGGSRYSSANGCDVARNKSRPYHDKYCSRREPAQRLVRRAHWAAAISCADLSH
jgi:hypothetical protein